MLLVDDLQSAEFFRQREVDVFLPNDFFSHGRVVSLNEVIDHFLNDDFRSTGTGGNQNGFHVIKPVRLQFGNGVDEVRRLADYLADFFQSATVRTVLAA